MILPLFFIPIVTLIAVNLFYFYFGRFINIISEFLDITIDQILKFITLISFQITLIYSIILWTKYPLLDENGYLIYPSNSWFELHHNLNLPFIILSIFILVIALLTSWYSSNNFQLLINLLLILEICLIGAFSCDNIFLFLFLFEVSAIPIFILVIYSGSDRRERIKAAYYFIFFTLYGSISLLLIIINTYNLISLTVTALQPLEFLNSNNLYSTWLLLFIAFAVKIPLFPFHIWLPYAHVEANTSTSILLAALMLKLGGYGILKFMLPLFSISFHLYFRPLALSICLIGLIYSSIVSIRQIDLKRQIAFSSISHMSLAIIGIFTFTEIGCKGAIYLMISHGLTSAGLFYLIGILSERYHTRSILVYSGLLNTMPLFSFFLIFMTLANIGFPGTSGFLPELLILISITKTSLLLLLPVLLGMFLTTVSSLIVLLKLLFGHAKVVYTESKFIDINFKDFSILFILNLLIIIVGLSDIFLFLNQNYYYTDVMYEYYLEKEALNILN